ncbi:hypothetical protein BGW80DRAFT_1252235 [Lactifluus volemus]|nr:hypothetical protein BGW80DRAFT_1252235 [Lactifluus volemus]
MSVLSLMTLSGLNMRIPSSVPLPICTLSINAAPWCLVGSILSDVVSSASVSEGLPSSTSPNDTNMPRLSDRNNCGPTCRLQQMPMPHYQVIPIARTCPSPPPRPLSKPFLQTTDSAYGGATPGPVESEDLRIADGSLASSAVRVDA